MSRCLVKKARSLGLFARLLESAAGESIEINDHLNRSLSGNSMPATARVRSVTWKTYLEQRKDPLRCLEQDSFQTEGDETAVYFIPMFGPDETIETSIGAIRKLRDDFFRNLIDSSSILKGRDRSFYKSNRHIKAIHHWRFLGH